MYRKKEKEKNDKILTEEEKSFKLSQGNLSNKHNKNFKHLACNYQALALATFPAVSHKVVPPLKAPPMRQASANWNQSSNICNIYI